MRTLLKIVPVCPRKVTINTRSIQLIVGKDTHMTSSSSFVRKVIAVPCFPARPVRPEKGDERKLGEYKGGLIRTNTMHVCFNGVGHLVVDNQSDVLDINTTTGKVSSHQNVRVPVAQGLQRGFSLFLILS